jgi:hypothetical protein
MEMGQGAYPVQHWGQNPGRYVTNKQGISQIVVEGIKQEKDYPEDASPLMKEATVFVGVTLKRASAAQDLVDAGGIVIGTVTGGGAGLLTIPAELLYRLSVPQVNYTFDVMDWQEDVFDPD